MAIKGYIYITSTGYDPEHGKDLEDPYLEGLPTLGACMPNIRRQVVPGDHVFVVSGKVPQAPQLVLGGFEVAEKLASMVEAYYRFPSRHLRRATDGRRLGNIICFPDGSQHSLDTHNPDTFSERTKNYIVGRNPVSLRTDREIYLGRHETLPVLQQVLRKDGPTPIKVIGRWSKLDREQVVFIRDWLIDLKARADAWRTA